MRVLRILILVYQITWLPHLSYPLSFVTTFFPLTLRISRQTHAVPHSSPHLQVKSFRCRCSSPHSLRRIPIRLSSFEMQFKFVAAFVLACSKSYFTIITTSSSLITIINLQWLASSLQRQSLSLRRQNFWLYVPLTQIPPDLRLIAPF